MKQVKLMLISAQQMLNFTFNRFLIHEKQKNGIYDYQLSDVDT